MTTKNALARWWEQTTGAQRERLARFSDTTVDQLRHIVKGRREPSAGAAQRIARGTEKLALLEDTPVLTQGDLHADCRRCPYFKAAARKG